MLPTTDSQQHPLHLRQQIRDGVWTGPTTGLAPDYVQANLMILPQALADEFLLFCQRNPKPCPLIYVSEPGQTLLEAVGQGLDIRTDVPRYRVWRHGQLHAEVDDVTPYWRDDLVSFLIGCSFSLSMPCWPMACHCARLMRGSMSPCTKPISLRCLPLA